MAGINGLTPINGILSGPKDPSTLAVVVSVSKSRPYVNAGDTIALLSAVESLPKDAPVKVIPTTPYEGMGATKLYWSDRRAGTVVKVSKSLKTVTVQNDMSVRLDKNGQSENQEYRFERNENEGLEVFRLGKRGWKSKGGTWLSLGNRSEYYDPSF